MKKSKSDMVVTKETGVRIIEQDFLPTSPAPLLPTQTRTASVKFADLPLISKLDAERMQEAQQLLEECEDLTESLNTIKDRREAIIVKLAEMQADTNLPGFRYGALCYSTRMEDGRRSLDKQKLIESGVPVATIEACMKEGNLIVKRVFKNLNSHERKEYE